MCGIIAILSVDGPSLTDGPELEGRLDAGLDRIAHRGPDGRGIWIDPSGICGEEDYFFIVQCPSSLRIWWGPSHSRPAPKVPLSPCLMTHCVLIIGRPTSRVDGALYAVSDL